MCLPRLLLASGPGGWKAQGGLISSPHCRLLVHGNCPHLGELLRGLCKQQVLSVTEFLQRFAAHWGAPCPSNPPGCTQGSSSTFSSRMKESLSFFLDPEHTSPSTLPTTSGMGQSWGSGAWIPQVGALPSGRAVGALPVCSHRPRPSGEPKSWLWEEKLEKAGLRVPDLLLSGMAYQEFSSAQMSENTQQNLEPHARSPPCLPAPFPAVVKLLPESQPETKPSSVVQERFSCWWDWIQISPCCFSFFPPPFFPCIGAACAASEHRCLLTMAH